MMRRLLVWLAWLTLTGCVANFFVTYAMFATVTLPWTSTWLREADEPLY